MTQMNTDGFDAGIIPRPRRRNLRIALCLALALLAGACASRPGPAPASPNAAPVASATVTLPAAAATTPAPPSATAIASPSAMAPPTATQTATPSPTPTLHPLTIAAMRQRSYPGSDVTIEATLEPGANYQRFLASYQSEGLKIYALLTVPAGEKPAEGWPVIVFNHGFISPAQYRTTERYVAYVDWLARHGYIVFRPDYRGHGNSEGEARGAYGSPDYVVDVLNALATMKRYPDADPSRLGMWGHSMGGYITLRAMVISPDIKAGVIWAGVVGSYPDLVQRWRRGPPSDALLTATPSARRGWRLSLIETYGTPEENPQFWASISANSYLADLSGPVELHHGTADASVPIEFSTDLATEIAQAGGTVEYYTYEGDNHNLSGFFVQAMTRTIEFFDRYLKAP